MSYYPESVFNLIKNIARLPGIGEKTAERLALHLLHAPRREAEQLAQSILNLKDTVRQCGRCFGLSDQQLCAICRDPAREDGLLCVVEQPADMVSIEKAGGFKGRYHILGGALSPMNGVGPDELRMKELFERIRTEGITEVILATGTGVEGEATAAFIAEGLQGKPLRVSRIASGVPIGGDLKYVDQVTLRRALEGRHVI